VTPVSADSDEFLEKKLVKLCCELFQKFVTEISVLEMAKQALGILQ